MDPFTILILTLLALGGGGAGSAVVVMRRRQHRDAIRRGVLEKVDHHGRPLSIFDVFWDLGVSDYALALMDHHGLLLERPEDFHEVHHVLDDMIEAHGTYADFIQDNLAAVQEFYREHRQTGSRRKIPTLTLRQKKLLPVGEANDAGSQDESSALAPREESVPATQEARDEIERDLGRVVQDSVEDRRIFREQLSPLMMTLDPEEQQVAQRGVDVDEIAKLEPLQMLENIFQGRLTEEVQKLWRFRHLRSAKSRLDSQFEKLYEFYAEEARGNAAFYNALYDMARRWETEAERIAEMLQRRPWRGEAWEDCAESLVEESHVIAEQLSRRAKYNVDQTVERIHDFARHGDQAMAGYLLYLNHHAFFAGRAPGYGERVQKIERLAYRVQEELRKLKTAGEL